jgi:septum formation protein
MLILASGSPRRREMLARLGIAHRAVATEIDETRRPGEPPDAYAARLAREKAAACPAQAGDVILAADTIVVVDDAVLGKPADPTEARAMIERLAGRTHRVMTAYCVEPAGPTAVVTTEVDVDALSACEIAAYVAGGEWRGKAGGYAIQGAFAYAVRAVRGSYTNVVGLPLAEVVRDLVAAGALPDFPPGAIGAPS